MNEEEQTASADHTNAFVGVGIIVLLVLAAIVYTTFQAEETEISMENDEDQNTEITEDTSETRSQDPISEATDPEQVIPETNPFEQSNNPFDGYRNPFE